VGTGRFIPGSRARPLPGTGESLEDGPFPIKGSDKQFVMDWTTEEHTDVPVPVTAEGPGAETLTGRHPNTYVHDVLSKALGLQG
jgi:alkaline phosphatase